jgi:gliding motility-associated lipoprotein GldH
MKSFFGFVTIVFLVLSCDDERVYEKNIDFDTRYWPVTEKPGFEFEVFDTVQTYNLYCNVRNSLDYPYARIFITYYLYDSTGSVLATDMMQQMLFDDKTGEPLGESGLGDIYHHRIPFRMHHRFGRSGKYKVSFEQFMRTDTLSGVLAVGLRVEKAAGTIEEVKR